MAAAELGADNGDDLDALSSELYYRHYRRRGPTACCAKSPW
jgi:hypothetical protein